MRIQMTADFQPRRHDLLRIFIAVLWIGSLSLRLFYISVYLLDQASSGYRGALASASIVNGGIAKLWFLAFLPALAFGIAWYAFTSVPRTSREILGCVSTNRKIRSIANGAFCHAICLNLFVDRLLLVPLCVNAYDEFFASDALRSELFEPALLRDSPNPIDLLIVCTLLSLCVIGMQSLHVVHQLKGRIVRISIVFAVLLLVGSAAPIARVWNHMPMPIYKAILDTEQWQRELQAVALDGAIDASLAQSYYRMYLGTHDAQGRQISPLVARRVRIGQEPGDPCWTCLLPFSSYLSMGFPVALTSEPPKRTEPRMVMELPVSEDRVRLYRADRIELPREISIENLLTASLDGDWIILKADQMVRASTVIRILKELRSMGVRRVELAAVSKDAALIPERIMQILFNPEEIDDVTEGNVVPWCRLSPPPLPREWREKHADSVYSGCWRGDFSDKKGCVPYLSGRRLKPHLAGKKIVIGTDLIPYQILLTQLEIVAAQGATVAVIDEAREPFWNDCGW